MVDLTIGVGALTMVGLLITGTIGEILFGVVVASGATLLLVTDFGDVTHFGILIITIGLGMVVFMEIIGIIVFGTTIDGTGIINLQEVLLIPEEII